MLASTILILRMSRSPGQQFLFKYIEDLDVRDADSEGVMSADRSVRNQSSQ